MSYKPPWRTDDERSIVLVKCHKTRQIYVYIFADEDVEIAIGIVHKFLRDPEILLDYRTAADTILAMRDRVQDNEGWL